MKKRYYFIIILVILIPILIVTYLIKDSNQKTAIKIKDNEIITSVPNCSEPTIKIDKIRNIKLLDNVEIGNKQIGYKEDKFYAGYYDTQFGTKDDNCLINYENEEKTKELYGIMNNK